MQVRSDSMCFSINVQKYSVLILASVQDSLERKFGKDGGKIPIEPSDAFKARIAVSKLMIRAKISGTASKNNNLMTPFSPWTFCFKSVLRIN